MYVHGFDSFGVNLPIPLLNLFVTADISHKIGWFNPCSDVFRLAVVLFHNLSMFAMKVSFPVWWAGNNKCEGIKRRMMSLWWIVIIYIFSSVIICSPFMSFQMFMLCFFSCKTQKNHRGNNTLPFFITAHRLCQAT